MVAKPVVPPTKTNRARTGTGREDSGVSIDPATGRVIAFGRTRKRRSDADQFHIPPEIIPDGWDYQWVTFSVYGQEQTANLVSMQENGWTPVPADRHAGMFMPAEHKGSIIRDGLMLVERPMALTIEARQEEHRKSRTQSNDARRLFGMRGAPEKGFVTDTPTARRVNGVTTSYESTGDIPRPELQRIPNQGD